MSDHYLIYLVLVWIALISAASAFPQVFFFFFFFSFQPQWLTCSSMNNALFTDPTNSISKRNNKQIG